MLTLGWPKVDHVPAFDHQTTASCSAGSSFRSYKTSIPTSEAGATDLCHNNIVGYDVEVWSVKSE